MLTEIFTNQGDRMDTISMRLYGSPFLFDRVLAANPSLYVALSYPAGLRIVAPIIAPADRPVPVSSLPPWRRETPQP
jgi:phage tail protein X